MPQSGGLRRDALRLWWLSVMTAFWVAAVVTWVQRWEQAGLGGDITAGRVVTSPGFLGRVTEVAGGGTPPLR